MCDKAVTVFLALLGLSAGGVISAGVFAFLAIIGIFPRLMGKTGTGKQVRLYESFIVSGGILGNLVNLYTVPALGLGGAGQILLFLFGIATGIFVGCLVMSLAETLNAMPVFTRRVRLAEGLPFIILAVALGKLAGSLSYFWYGVGG